MKKLIFVLVFVLRFDGKEDEEQKLMCDEQRSKEAGEDVTLDCHHPTGRDVTNQSVYWEFNNIYVLVFRNRKISNVDQGEEFKGRASKGSSWNPAEGNLSLKISPVKAEDAGTYTCSIGQLNMFCSTSLSITPKSDGPRKAPDGNHGDQGSDITKMVTGIGGGGMGIGIGGGGGGGGMGIGIVGIICIGGILGIVGLVICCIKPIRSFFGRIMKSFRHRDQMVKLDPPS